MPDPTQRLLFLVAFEGDELVGYLPLRTYRERLWGRENLRIGLLNWREMDRPQAVARAEHEAACCAAFYRHLVEEVRGWSFLALTLQDDASGLLPGPSNEALEPLYVRTMPSLLRYGIPLEGLDLEAYWSTTLSANQRSNVSRSARKLLQAGRTEYLASGDRSGFLSLLDLFLDLERRSWQAHAGANVGRRPERIAMFRELLAPDGGLDGRFLFLLLDGVPVAGMLKLCFEGTDHMVGIVFDGAYEHLAPGNLLMLLAVKDSLDRRIRELNLGYGGGHYKTRWGGILTSTVTVEAIRPWSAHHLKARMGDLKRSLRPPQGPPTSNVRRKEAEAAHPPPAAGARRTEEQALATRLLAELAGRGVLVERLEGEAILAGLPFSRAASGGKAARKGSPATPGVSS